MLTEMMRRGGVAFACLCLLTTALPPTAAASIVSTADAVALELRADALASVRAGLAREDVRERMVTLGVDPQQVDGRLDAMTGVELAALAEQLESAPAGGDVLAVVGIVFLVLLLLEYTGTIDIFKKVP
jgi:hypothetical protein